MTRSQDPSRDDRFLPPALDPPEEAASWPRWIAWLGAAIQRLGAYESALSRDDLRCLTTGLDRLSRQLTAERIRFQTRQEFQGAAGSAAVLAAAMHGEARLQEAVRHCDEARLLLGALARASEADRPARHRGDVTGLDRLRQQARWQFEQIQQDLGGPEAHQPPWAWLRLLQKGGA